MLNKYTYLLEDIKKWLFVSFAFFLPVSQKISTINIVLLVVFSLLNIQKERIDFKKEFIAPIGLYIIYCLSLIYSSELQLGIIEQKASLLFFPIIFIFNKDAFKYHELILKYFVLGCLIALVICELNAFYNSFNFDNLYFNSRIDKSISFYSSLSNEKNYFFSYNFSFIHQTVYFSMYILFSISILLYKEDVFKDKKIRNIGIIFLTIGLFQTLNKAGFLIFIFIIAIYLYNFIINKRKAIIGVILFAIFGIALFFINPRFIIFKKSFVDARYEIKEKDFKKINNQNPNYQDFRVMLWSSALELIKENPIIGIGAGGSHNRLYEVFAVKRQWYDKNEKYHAHNQYLQVLLDLGVLGFIPFLFILSNLKFFFSEESNKNIAISFILLIGINFLFESMFERYSGISFFSFFYCLFISSKSKNYIN